MGFLNKKTKQNLSESDSENEASDFPRFIILESLEETCLAKFSQFLIEKVELNDCFMSNSKTYTQPKFIKQKHKLN